LITVRKVPDAKVLIGKMKGRPRRLHMAFAIHPHRVPAPALLCGRPNGTATLERGEHPGGALPGAATPALAIRDP